MRAVTDLVRRHLGDPLSHHRRIAAGMAWVLLFALIGKAAGAAKEVAIAWRFGVSEVVDGYVFIYNLVTWPVAVWFGILTAVLVPLSIGRDPSEQRTRFQSEVFGLTLAAGVVLLGVAWWLLPRLLRAPWSAVEHGGASGTVAMASILSLTIPLGMCISLFSARLLAGGWHKTTLLEAIPAITIIGALLLFRDGPAEALVWGTVAGFAFQMVALGSVKSGSATAAPAFSFKSPLWRDFWAGMSMMSVGQLVMSLTGLVDQFFAVALDTGALSTLSYASRILGLVLTIGATAVSRATLPIFSEVHLSGKADARSLGLRWALWMFLGGAAIAGLASLLAPWGVALLFERGAFTPANTVAVADTLVYLLLQTPFYASGLVLVSVLAAQRRYGVLAAVAVCSLLVKVAAAAWLTAQLQLAGLALSSTAMHAAALLLFWTFLRSSGEVRRADRL